MSSKISTEKLHLPISKQPTESTRLTLKSCTSLRLSDASFFTCCLKSLFYFALQNLHYNFFSIRNIPSVDEAWKLPIPAELTTRTIRNAQVRALVKN